MLNNIGEWAVIVENKVLSDEHSGQLARYHRFANKAYRGWDVFGIYLTRFGDNPSHEAYDPLDYLTLCGFLDDVLQDRDQATNTEARIAIRHYTDMVRRHLVGSPEAIKLAHEIYQRHRKALDFIHKHRPDPQRSIKGFLLRLVDETEGLVYKQETAGGTYLYFCPEAWEVPNGFVGFVFHNHADQLELFLEISWGDNGSRRRLFEIAKRDDSPFNHLVENTRRGTNPKLYYRSFLAPGYYEDYSEQERQQEILRQWAMFLADLERMKAMLREETRTWKSIGAVEGHSDTNDRFVEGGSESMVDEQPAHGN